MPSKRLKAKIIVHVAVVTNGYGTEVFIGATLKSLYEQLAKYCRWDWNNMIGGPLPSSDKEIVDRYFSEELQEAGQFIDFIGLVEVK